MIIAELMEILSEHNPQAIVRFSIADDSSEDGEERWFAEDGVHDCFGNGHPELGLKNETEVTICLVVETNKQKDDL